MRIIKQPLTILFILIVLGLSAWLYFDSSSPAKKRLVYNEEPTYKSQQILTTVYDPTGKLSYKLISGQVEHFTNRDETWFTKPVMTLFDSEINASWTIKANQAKLTNQKILYLYGEVEVDNLSPDSQIEKIKTDNAEINLTTQDILSDDPVSLFGHSFTTTGLKLRGNLKTKTANLLEKVNTYYGAKN